MAFDENIIRQNRIKLGQFFQARRLEMGHSLEDAAQHIGISANTLNRIEAGRFPWDIDLHLKICEAYELKPFLAPFEYLQPNPHNKPKFLLCPHEDSKTLYILHRDYPECLIEAVQTIPTTFEIKDIYALSNEEEIIRLGVLEMAKKFFHEQVTKDNQN